MALLEFFKTNRDLVRHHNIQQIVAMAGDGRLLDDTDASRELRDFLKQVPREDLFRYAQACLSDDFPSAGLVLQDIVNEFGRRLDFDVENGAYRGKKGHIGCDGIWRYAGEPEIVVEVKTSSTYTIKLETISGYRDRLIDCGRVAKTSSILIVVGKEGTEALEAQVRGSRFSWDIRLIGIEALMRLVEVREQSEDPSTTKQIRELLHPFEYTKLDRIINVTYSAAIDVRQQEDEVLQKEINIPERLKKQVQSYTDPALLNEKRMRAVEAFATLEGSHFIKRSPALYWNADRTLRVACTVSKRYERDYQPYWYAYHESWDDFLKDGHGFVILVCMDSDTAFAIPREWFDTHKEELSFSEKSGRKYWHIALTLQDGQSLAINASRVGKKYSLSEYQFNL